MRSVKAWRSTRSPCLSPAASASIYKEIVHFTWASIAWAKNCHVITLFNGLITIWAYLAREVSCKPTSLSRAEAGASGFLRSSQGALEAEGGENLGKEWLRRREMRRRAQKRTLATNIILDGTAGVRHPSCRRVGSARFTITLIGPKQPPQAPFELLAIAPSAEMVCTK
jgi:hypothetical protein